MTIEIVSIEELAPQEHLLRKVEKAVGFGKLSEIVEPFYSEDEGRPGIDPVALFKIVLLQHLDGLASLRGTLRRAETDIAYRWFLGYTLNQELPHFSTVSYNFRRKLLNWSLPTRKKNTPCVIPSTVVWPRFPNG